jgi:hypothetical protein
MPIYEYKGQQYELKDGLSNEEALAKIKGHLGEAPEAPKPAPAPAVEESTMEGLQRGFNVGAKALGRGFSAPVNMVADAVAGGANIVANLFGSDFRLPYLSQVQRKGFDQMLPGKAVSTPEKMLEGGIEALSGAGATNMVAAPVKALQGLVTSGVPAVTATAAGGAAAPAIYDEAKEVVGDGVAAGIISALGAGAVGSKAGSVASKVIDRTGKPLTLEQIKQASQRAYSELETSGVTINPWSIRGMLAQAEKKMEVSRLDPEVKSKMDTLKKFVMEDYALQGKPVPIKQVDEMRKYASDLRKSTDASVQRLGSQMVDEIDDYMATIPKQALVTGTSGDAAKAAEAVQNARQNWLQYSRAKVIKNVLDDAEIKSNRLTAAQAEQIRQGLTNLATSPTKKKLFSKDELDAIVAATKDGPIGNIVSHVARMNPQRGGFLGSGTAGGAAMGSTTGNSEIAKSSLLLAGAGWSADQIAKLMHNSRGRKLMSDVANGTVKPPAPSEFPRGLFGAAVSLQGEEQE